MKVIAIIPAAGLGTRMAAAETAPRSAVGKGPSKQFAELHGVPILVHTLRTFAASPQVTEIYVALRKAEADSFRPRLEKEVLGKKVHLVEGGEHRQQSVANALAAVKAAPDDIILVHDAVRPLVDEEIIANVVQGAEKHGAAIAGVPAVDTVKQVERSAENAIITATVPRERVVLAQTPQGFRFSVLKKAFDEAAADGFVGTDEASLVERSGHAVAVVMGSARNLKITTPADLELAEFYMSRPARRAAG
ncbi:MAG TPA: 2-C-methyl-D-erythritol 4-phosphate cytidylyltransferase [Terriglobales bacterium]|nr:2-C-methyl-D-erythritol 4-phosphate cytidylyltransferase [Terriglobales bacterium]